MSELEYYLMQDQNKAILEGRQQVPAEFHEVFSNLSRCAGLQLPSKIGKSAASFPIGLGVAFMIFGALVVILAIGLFVNTLQENNIHYVPISLVVGAVGTWIVVLLGFAQLYKALVVSRHSFYVEECLQALVTTGKVVPGEVVSSSQITEHHRQIQYQFSSPDDGRLILGSHITSVEKDFPPHSRVVVFYLNRHMHVLL